MPKAQYKELLATQKFQFKKVSAHTSHDNQKRGEKKLRKEKNKVK